MDRTKHDPYGYIEIGDGIWLDTDPDPIIIAPSSEEDLILTPSTGATVMTDPDDFVQQDGTIMFHEADGGVAVELTDEGQVWIDIEPHGMVSIKSIIDRLDNMLRILAPPNIHRQLKIAGMSSWD